MGEGKHSVKACHSVAVEAGDIAVAVIGYAALGLQVVGGARHTRKVQGVRQAFEPVIVIAVGVGRRSGDAVVRLVGDLADVAVEACRGAGLLRGGIAEGLSEHKVLPPVVPRFDARGPAVEVVAESKRNPAHVFAWAGQKR